MVTRTRQMSSRSELVFDETLFPGPVWRYQSATFIRPVPFRTPFGAAEEQLSGNKHTRFDSGIAAQPNSPSLKRIHSDVGTAEQSNSPPINRVRFDLGAAEQPNSSANLSAAEEQPGLLGHPVQRREIYTTCQDLLEFSFLVESERSRPMPGWPPGTDEGRGSLPSILDTFAMVLTEKEGDTPLDGTSYGVLLPVTDDHRSLREALSAPDARHWIKAIHEE